MALWGRISGNDDAESGAPLDVYPTGTTALVTGASRGVGLATASALLEEGMRVVAHARAFLSGAAGAESVHTSAE
ncbi:SDR family NAD(P)-dependent oxidoreductase [Streptomyces sp. NBC_01283]|uniref:SDR family NAD(P)-dependent oxidoreductase n=1 Tax=Streptomyces sp. NBC_01283 TaxID=2903812 RepID=UPI00352E6B44|nr:SDR family NAD(P)-dependent oxidoreductase [Streptomyces sp. NBC_01283]